jgi:hypothetical protein
LSFGAPIPPNGVTDDGTFGFTIEPATDRAYVFVNGTGLRPSRFIVLDLATGAQVGSTVSPGGADVYPALGSKGSPATFYAWDFTTSSLGTVDPARGAFTSLGASGITLDVGVASARQVGLDFRSNGAAYFVGLVEGVSTLYSPDTVTGNLATHRIGTFSAPIRDIAVAP